MKMRYWGHVALVLASGCGAVVAAAAEKPVELRRDASRDRVEANCATCHSLDYVQMNSPFPSAAQWDAEVAKMIKAYGAQVPADQIPVVVDYLTANYGRASPAPK